MKRTLLKLLLLSAIELIQLNNIGRAQVLNIDRENGQDSISKMLTAAFDMNFSLDKQKGNFIDFNNKAEVDFSFKKDLVLIFLNSTELSFSGSTVIENNSYFQLRFRDDDKRRLFPDTYIQYQWNGILGMSQRAIAGSNLRFKWFDKEKVDLYSSVGVFAEHELWDASIASIELVDSTQVVQRNIGRLNTSFKFAWNISKTIDFATVNYVQFPLNSNFQTPRWYFDANLNLAFNKRWSAIIHYEHNYDSYRPLPIDEYYYALTIGLRLQV